MQEAAGKVSTSGINQNTIIPKKGVVTADKLFYSSIVRVNRNDNGNYFSDLSASPFSEYITNIYNNGPMLFF